MKKLIKIIASVTYGPWALLLLHLSLIHLTPIPRPPDRHPLHLTLLPLHLT